QIVHNGKPVEARRYVTDLFTDAAIEFIEGAKDRPWFCYLALNAPHSPWVVGTSHDGQARGDLLINKYLKRGLVLREARIYAMIDIIDQNVGRLLKRLDELDLADDTVVVFMTDNGGVSKHFKAGLKGNKGSIYEGGVRVPLLVRWPDHFPAGGVVAAQCSHVDLFPTFCELAGQALPADLKIDGISLAPLLKAGAGQRHHEYVYHAWDRYHPNPNNRWAISDQRWKLACQVRTGEQATQQNWRLYDLANDPGEKNNVLGKHPQIVKRLRTEFLRWFREVTDGVKYQPAPIPIGHPDERLVEIQPSWATWRGKNIEYVFRGYDWDTIQGWREPGESASWRIDALRGGEYEVAISYGRSARGGGTLKIAVGDQAVETSPPATPTADVFTRIVIGRVSIPRGATTLKAEVVKAHGVELMRLNGVFLRRVGDLKDR
ncbi:MAG: sulfatase-like hydrolase/transferase, partial [Pirellulaceae bacterium]|nr:sulfatase-like hydrolase/transferase [Pirellulaceae bacterium]